MSRGNRNNSPLRGGIALFPRPYAGNLLTASRRLSRFYASGVPCRLVPNPQLRPSLSSGSFLARFYLANHVDARGTSSYCLKAESLTKAASRIVPQRSPRPLLALRPISHPHFS